MGIGLSGMVSGLDTDAIVQAMVSAQRTKSTKIENKITLNKWTTEAWSGLNTKIYSFYTKYASKLRLQSSFMTRTAKSSNEDVVTAKAESTAAVGTHTLQINKLASSQYVTGGQIQKDGKKANYNKNSKLTEMGVTAGTVITIAGKKGSDDETVKKLEVTEKTTVNDFITACKDAGLTASFDETQQRFFISSAESGTDEKFSITTAALNTTGTQAFKNITDYVTPDELSSEDKAAYETAMTTLRQNVGLLDDVLADGFNYDTADATQKAVKDAVEKVKKIVAGQQAEIAAEAAENDAIKGSIETAFDKLADIEDGTDTTTLTTAEAFKVYNKSYTYDELKTLRDTASESLVQASKTAAEKAGNDAVAALKETYGENYVTKAEAVAAQDKIDKYNEALAAGTTDQDELDTLKTEAEEAQKVVDKWENAPVDADGNTLKDADGNELVSLKSVYETAYNATYVSTPAEEDVIAEIQKSVITENQAEYDAAVAAEKEVILLDAAADSPSSLAGQALASILGDIENGLEEAGTTGTTTGALSGIGLGEIAGTAVNETSSTSMVVVEASDAEFVLDGATMTETSNNFTVNGITLNLSDTTFDETTNSHKAVQITVGKDGDATYDLIKEALTEYNKLIEEMNKLYNADSARGYDPLTDEQKEAMTEDDIKNWEDKIKGSLLRRDDSLGSLLNSMRSALSSTYTDEDDGKTYSLSTFGIVTGNYTEKGKLHIYGDEDDPTYATYGDRLKKALEDDPDQVMEVLTNVFGKLYDTMTEKCAKTEISSALTFYNDKQYKNLLDDYEDDLDIMEDRIKELEDRYYKQFTAMETALSKLQSQTNSLASLLGTGTQ
ncbi:MAG: flagellar filament capping protein FliD [Lachnospiraceae bacterium]|nr:flagellar filament capping protein FliD [Lachnospiraceae bacterium]